MGGRIGAAFSVGVGILCCLILLVGCGSPLIEQIKDISKNTSDVAADKASLAITYAGGESATSVTGNLTLPTTGAHGTTISWSSDHPSIVSATGMVVRPTSTTGVTLTATITKGGASETKQFPLTVLQVPATDSQAVADDKATLQIIYASGDKATSVTGNLTLPTTGPSGTTISWSSDYLAIVSATGVVTLPTSTTSVTLTATIMKGIASDTKAFTVTVIISDSQAVANDKAALQITYASGDSSSSVTQNLTLPTTGPSGTTISWSSDHLSIVSATGVVTRPTSTTSVTLTATIAKGSSSDTQQFILTVPFLMSIAWVTIYAAGDSFTMGDGTYDQNVSESLSYNFTMSKYEITNAQFAQFTADGGYTTQGYWTTNGWYCKQSNGWTQPAIYSTEANAAVWGVSWYEAVAYCNWRSAKEGLTPAYNSSGQANLRASGYRLPTEVEWEYAAAKGASGQVERIYPWGDTWDSNKAVCNVPPAWANKPADVGSKSAAGGDTPQGLADMSGNVKEWCSDNYGSVAAGTDRYYIVNDSNSQAFTVRGGGLDANVYAFRCAYRDAPYPPGTWLGGIRMVRYLNDLIQWPAAPSGLGASVLSMSSIRLTWTDNSTNAMGFKIERSPDGTTGWTQVQLTADNETSWDDPGLSAGTTYYYRVRATNAAGDSPYSNTVSADTLSSFSGGVTIYAAGDSFTMGDGTYGPNVSESLSYNFTMSKYEITNNQFAQFVADGGYTTQSYWTTNGWAWKSTTSQPAFWNDSNFNGANQPVVGVSWYEAAAYCNWRSVKEGLTAAYNSSGQANLSASGYRLPTEVEWEYAASKGGSGQAERIYAWGDTWPSDSSKAVCCVSPASATKPADFGSKSTAGDTPQGLVDMSGNVWEWCSDNYGSVAAGTDRYFYVTDSTSQSFMLRGGSWADTGESYLRCACRSYTGPNFPSQFNGFRVVRR